MRKVLFIGVLLFAGALVAGVVPLPFQGEGDGPGELPTLRVARQTLTESTVALGTVKPQVGAEVKVGSQISGVVASLEVDIGDRVEKGQLLAALQDAEWRARLTVLEAEHAAAVAELEYARDELSRFTRITNISELQVVNSRRNVAVREAEVQRIEGRLAEAQILLGYTVIRAPVSGTIASVSTYEGETVAASLSAPTFVTIIDLTQLEVQAFVDETDIGKVYAGQDVTFRVDAYPGEQLPGRVQAIYPKAQLTNNVVNYLVIIEILEARDLLLRPEMTAHVSFILEERPDVLSVPRKALLRTGGKDYLIVKKNGEWYEQPIEVGLQTVRRIEIVSGVEEGAVVVADKQVWKDRSEEE